MDITEHLKREKFYDLVEDEDGNQRTVFSHMTIETDENTFVFGDKCSKCGSVLVPRMMKSEGNYRTIPYCPKCKG